LKLRKRHHARKPGTSCDKQFNGLISRTTSVTRRQKGLSNLDFNEARDDGKAVVPTGPYANHLHLAPYFSTSSLNFYKPNALPDAQPTVSKH